ncbi:MAG: ankyrin repeat domain-containing protein [Verrucomicrobia bacterium]|nr:ankyrin repeat domain-containing protein [Verrucomicrobiota bacterium]
MKKMFRIILVLLIVVGALVVARQVDGYGRNRLFPAANADAAWLCQILIWLGANPNQQDRDGETPLNVAAIQGNLATVAVLLRNGARTDIQTAYGPVICSAARWAKTEDCIRLLLRSGADVNLPNAHTGQTSLMTVCAVGHSREALETLLAFRADLDMQDNNGRTALMHAILKNDTVLATLLLKAGVNVNLQSKAGETALSIAHQRNMTDLIPLLKTSRATTNLEAKAAPTIPADKLNNQDQWALLTVAMIDLLNGDTPGLLGSGRSQRQADDKLSRDYGVENRADAIALLNQLIAAGDCKQFDELAAQVGNMPETEFQKWVANQAPDPVPIVRAKLVRRAKTAKGGVLAWDLCRCVHVASLSAMAGYLPADEAWQRIHTAADQMRSHFSSWQEMGQSFMLGFQFVTCGQGYKYIPLLKYLCNLKETNNPWALHPWPGRPK